MKNKKLLCNLLLFGFLLGIYEGKIALWRGEETKPLKVFPYQASMLPKADQKLLEKGIKIDSLSQLHKLLEDYLS
jgi:hypothetical protein